VQTPVGGGEPTLRIETELTKDKSKGEFANVAAIVGAIKAQHPEILKDRAAPVEQGHAVPRGHRRFRRAGSSAPTPSGPCCWPSSASASTVSLRFETGFGVAAMVATLHDVLMTVALFVFFGGQFNAALIAAILLIIGYSVNDTIVVFDRIREELPEQSRPRASAT
jgi:SecD/SecF fusion protein